MGTLQSRNREAPPTDAAAPAPEVPQGGAARREVSPDWITAALRQTWSELVAFARTAVDFVGHPARFGRRWTAPDTQEQNPLGFAATSFALVGTAGTGLGWLLLPASSKSDSIGEELLSWLLPYAYFLLLGIIQHACLRLFGSRRRLRDSCAMALYAGGGAGMPTQMVSTLFFAGLMRLGFPTTYTFSDIAYSWTARFTTVLMSASVMLFFASLGAAQTALHETKRWKVFIATLAAVLVTGLLFGLFHPPGSYGMHLSLRFKNEGGHLSFFVDLGG